MIWTIAKKELRGYFNSAVALIFIGTFLAQSLYMFFWHEKFFARGLADLRPLFSSMPLTLTILVAALSMRLWAEERKTGTLELLLTLPVARWRLVVGKFVGAMMLLAIALALTFGLPITVGQMGSLDGGPVIGGYIASLLLAAAYLVIGMCVSAATSNQIVALFGTLALCFVFYLFGSLGGPLASLGSGVRFESVARGVLDLRDLAYYGGIIASGIALNVLILERFTWASGPATRTRHVATILSFALVAANSLALVLWLAPVGRARIDLTKDGTYSLSESTEKILAGLDEKLLIRGYFTERTHPKLAPLIPQIRDLLDEYRVQGDGKVRVEFLDPSESDEAKQEAKERFAIDPTPLRFATENEKSVVNAYFNIAIQYGDQHTVLKLDDLIQVRVLDIGELEITAKNLEYQLTKTIKKTVAEFSSVDSLFASSASKVELTAYITPDKLPEAWKEGPAKLAKVIEDLNKQSNGKLTATTVEPKAEAEMRDLFQKYGLRPYSDPFANSVYYFHIMLKVGDRMVRIVPPQNVGEAELKTAITEGLKRAAPGFTRIVGIWQPPQPPPQPPMMEGMQPQQVPPPQTFRSLQQTLGGNYEVRQVQLSTPIPQDIETLILAGPAALDDKAAREVDQFVMRGGALVVLAGRYRLKPSQSLEVEKVTTGIEKLFDKWGIKLSDEMVMDMKSDVFPVPQMRDIGNGMQMREVVQLAYPFFVKMDGDQMSSSVITSGLSGSVLHWASPVTAELKVGDDEHKVEKLLKSSSDGWLTSMTEVQPNARVYPDIGFAKPKELPADKKGSQVLALSIIGGFTSAFAGDKTAKPDPENPAAARLLEHSPPDTRIVVFGSSAFASDDIMQLAQQMGSDLASSNIEMVHNAVDWSLADTDLLEIRSHNAAARAITVPVDERNKWRTINIVVAFLGLGALVGIAAIRRRSVQPIVTGKEA